MQDTLLERKQIKNIDFNCDLAQEFGVYKSNKDYALLDYVSSVAISCGFHAGDPVVIKKALLEAKDRGLAIGAHIGYADIQGFGYRDVELSDDEIETLVIYQVGALMSFAKAFSLDIEFVRPHGAMYMKMGEDFHFSCVVANAVKKCSNWLTLYSPLGDIAEKTSEYVNIKVAQELMLEKTYNTDLTVDYSIPDNTDNYNSIKRLQHLLHTSQLRTINQGMASVNVSTIHFNNKYPSSLGLLKQASDIIKPLPLNYISAKESGWAE